MASEDMCFYPRTTRLLSLLSKAPPCRELRLRRTSSTTTCKSTSLSAARSDAYVDYSPVVVLMLISPGFSVQFAIVTRRIGDVTTSVSPKPSLKTVYSILSES